MFDFENRTKPILKWAGGKSALLKQLIPHFPKNCARYFEPFLGGGSAFLALRNGIPAIVNDVNAEIINLYQVVRDDAGSLCDALDEASKVYCERFYYDLRASTPNHPVEKAARTIVLNKTGYNGLYRQNAKGEFNVPFGKRVNCPRLYDKENLYAFSRRLAGATLLNDDFESVLAQVSKGDVAYLDPPYDPISNTSSFSGYYKGGFGKDDQERLFACCNRAAKRGATILVSNSATPFIKELYKDFDLKPVIARRAINSNASKRGPIPEVLVVLR